MLNSKYKLGECCTIIAGQSPESKYYNLNGDGLPFFQGKADFGDVYPQIRVYCSQPIKIAEKDDILLSVRAPVGPTNLAPCKVCIGRGLTAIRPKDFLLTKYLLLYLKSFELELASQGKGTTFKSITQNIIKNLEIWIPSIEKQKQIVKQIEESLSQLDSAVETLNKTKQQLEIYRQAVLKEAFLGKLSSHRPVSCSLSFLSSQESNNYPPIANEWKYIKLSCLGELARGKSKHRPRNDRKLFENGKYPFVQTGDVKKSDKYITDYENMYGDFGLQQSKLWKKGTLCITIAANIAETAFLGMDACFPDSIVGFLPSEYVLPEYIRYFIESQKVRLWAFAPATAQKNINLKTLENLVIPYCSIEEQAEIIKIVDEKMSVCDRIKLVINQSLQQAEALRQSILKQAFEGN